MSKPHEQTIATHTLKDLPRIQVSEHGDSSSDIFHNGTPQKKLTFHLRSTIVVRS